jgi:hypothetical protein
MNTPKTDYLLKDEKGEDNSTKVIREEDTSRDVDPCPDVYIEDIPHVCCFPCSYCEQCECGHCDCNCGHCDCDCGGCTVM